MEGPESARSRKRPRADGGLRSLAMLNDMHGYLRDPPPAPPPPSLSDSLAQLSHSPSAPRTSALALTSDLAEGRNEEAGIRVATSEDGACRVFATRPIAAQTVVGELAGEVATLSQHGERVGEASPRRCTFTLSDELVLDATDSRRSSWARFIAHDAEAPTLAARSCTAGRGGGRVWFVTLRDVERGEELTFDHADVFVAPGPVGPTDGAGERPEPRDCEPGAAMRRAPTSE